MNNTLGAELQAHRPAGGFEGGSMSSLEKVMQPTERELADATKERTELMEEVELLRQDIARLANVFSQCSNSVTMIAATFPNASDYIGQMEREITSIKDKQSIASMLMSFEVRKAPKTFPSGNKRHPHWYKLELFSDGSGKVVDSNTTEILFTFGTEKELIHALTR